MIHFLRELIATHYWPDPLWALLFDLLIVATCVFIIVALWRLGVWG